MGIQTSNITTDENDDLSLNPAGTGKVILSKNAGDGETPISVDSQGAIKKLDVDELEAAGESDSGDILLIQRGNNLLKIDAEAVGGAGQAIPSPSDVKADPPFESGSGTLSDPWFITPSVVNAPGGSASSVQTITVSNQKPGSILNFAVLKGTSRFSKEAVICGADGSAVFRLPYLDSPETQLGTVYEGEIQMGSVYFRWDVTQIKNLTEFGPEATPTASPSTVNYSADAKYGTVVGTWADGNEPVVVTGDAYITTGTSWSKNISPSNGEIVQIKFDELVVNAAAEGDVISSTISNGDGFLLQPRLIVDRTPDPYAIPNEIDAPTSTAVTFSSIQLTGITAPTELNYVVAGTTLTSPEVSIDGDSWTAIPVTGATGITVNPGSNIQVRATTGATQEQDYTLVLDVNGVTSTVTATTYLSTGDPVIYTPQLITPPNGTVDLSPADNGNQILLQGSAYAGANSPGAHIQTDWQTYRADGTVQNPTSSIVSNVASTSIPGANYSNSGFTVADRGNFWSAVGTDNAGRPGSTYFMTGGKLYVESGDVLGIQCGTDQPGGCALTINIALLSDGSINGYSSGTAPDLGNNNWNAYGSYSVQSFTYVGEPGYVYSWAFGGSSSNAVGMSGFYKNSIKVTGASSAPATLLTLTDDTQLSYFQPGDTIQGSEDPSKTSILTGFDTPAAINPSLQAYCSLSYSDSSRWTDGNRYAYNMFDGNLGTYASCAAGLTCRLDFTSVGGLYVGGVLGIGYAGQANGATIYINGINVTAEYNTGSQPGNDNLATINSLGNLQYINTIVFNRISDSDGVQISSLAVDGVYRNFNTYVPNQTLFFENSIGIEDFGSGSQITLNNGGAPETSTITTVADPSAGTKVIQYVEYGSTGGNGYITDFYLEGTTLPNEPSPTTALLPAPGIGGYISNPDNAFDGGAGTEAQIQGGVGQVENGISYKIYRWTPTIPPTITSSIWVDAYAASAQNYNFCRVVFTDGTSVQVYDDGSNPATRHMYKLDLSLLQGSILTFANSTNLKNFREGDPVASNPVTYNGTITTSYPVDSDFRYAVSDPTDGNTTTIRGSANGNPGMTWTFNPAITVTKSIAVSCEPNYMSLSGNGVQASTEGNTLVLPAGTYSFISFSMSGPYGGASSVNLNGMLFDGIGLPLTDITGPSQTSCTVSSTWTPLANVISISESLAQLTVDGGSWTNGGTVTGPILPAATGFVASTSGSTISLSSSTGRWLITEPGYDTSKKLNRVVVNYPASLPVGTLDSRNLSTNQLTLSNASGWAANGSLRAVDVSRLVNIIPGYPTGDVPGAGYTLVDQSLADTSNLVNYNVPGAAFTPEQSYYTHLRYRSASTDSSYSNWSKFTTGSATGGSGVVLYSGNGVAQSVTGVGFAPDMVWIKSRNTTVSHLLFDTIRGPGVYLSPDENIYEIDSPTDLTSFNSDGFSVGSNSTSNGSDRNFVAWCWKAGDSVETNNDGSATSQVTTSGNFSVVTWDNGSAPCTVGHGLETAPSFIITKSLDSLDWAVYHTSLGNNSFLTLNNASDGTSQSSYWDNTATTMGFGNSTNNNTNSMVAYAWSEVAGVSSFGTYSGNSGTTSITTGFAPSIVIVKGITTSSNWWIFDRSRGDDRYLVIDEPSSEGISLQSLELTADGFTLNTSDLETNLSGYDYVYAAFA